MNQCWNIVNWTLRNKLQWHLNRNSCIFIQENAFEMWTGNWQPFWFQIVCIVCSHQCAVDGLAPLTAEISADHYSDVIMGAMASQITSLTIVFSTVYWGTDQRKHQSSVTLAFVGGIPRWLGNSPHKWPATWKMFPFDDIIMHDGNQVGVLCM